MNESRKPVAHTDISVLAMALSLTLAAPVLAGPPAAKTGMSASNAMAAKAKSPKPQSVSKAPATAATGIGSTAAAMPTPAVAATRQPVQPAVPASSQARPSEVVMAMPAAAGVAIPTPTPALAAAAPVVVATVPVAAPTVPAVAPAASAAPAAQSVNPYLAGWYRPVPAVVLPVMAMGQINYSARYVSDRVTSLPSKLADALPSIKTVHPTGGRDLVVVNLKCPVETMTGQYMLPANAMREGVNGLLSKLNETQLLNFDIQLVCS